MTLRVRDHQQHFIPSCRKRVSRSPQYLINATAEGTRKEGAQSLVSGRGISSSIYHIHTVKQIVDTRCPQSFKEDAERLVFRKGDALLLGEEEEGFY
jgi:hypothetical protein